MGFEQADNGDDNDRLMEHNAYRYRFRDYNAMLGRWSSQDAVAYLEGESRFEYVASPNVEDGPAAGGAASGVKAE